MTVSMIAAGLFVVDIRLPAGTLPETLGRHLDEKYL